MAQNAKRLTHPRVHEVILLGERHAGHVALSRIEFLDFFKLDISDVRGGYSASALYHVYLRSRTQARMQDSSHAEPQGW
ncbi:hypothetical protein [Planobispora longispora]|nr:hypothetical protein [Planobispora longispora]